MKNLKITASILCLSLSIGLVGCNGSSDTNNVSDIPNQANFPNGSKYGSTFYKGHLENTQNHTHPLVRSRNEAHTSHITIAKPNTTEIDADGFFQLKGYSINPNEDMAEINHDYVLVEVNKIVDSTVDTEEYKPIYYFLRGDFSEKIWLRYGKGEYVVDVFTLESVVADLYGDGDIRSFRREKGDADKDHDGHNHDHHNHDHHNHDHDNHNHHGHNHSAGHTHDPVDTRKERPPLFSFRVNNVRDEDGRFYYPSQNVQSDNESIHQKALQLTQDKKSTAEKIQALHTFVLDHLMYDEASLRPGERKTQDALNTFNNGLAVCEGYTSLMASLTRSIGIKTKVIAGFAGNPGYDKGAHAWVKVLVDGEWKYIDPTMNDDYNSRDLQDILLDTLPETHELHPYNPERPDV